MPALQVDWLCGIFRTTFWANNAAYSCSLAAMAIAKRGLNVDYVFCLMGNGGVGMSLTTSNIAAQLGNRLHKYGDPNAFFQDDELRKQVRGVLAYGNGCVSWVPQECRMVANDLKCSASKRRSGLLSLPLTVCRVSPRATAGDTRGTLNYKHSTGGSPARGHRPDVPGEA